MISVVNISSLERFEIILNITRSALLREIYF